MNCCMLVSNGCCSSCKQYKNNSLVRQLKRLTDNKENDPSCTSSHTNYRFLSTAQKDKRLKKLHSELRSKTRRLQLLQKAIAQTYECDTISLDEDLSDDLSVLMKQGHLPTPFLEAAVGCNNEEGSTVNLMASIDH